MLHKDRRPHPFIICSARDVFFLFVSVVALNYLTERCVRNSCSVVLPAKFDPFLLLLLLLRVLWYRRCAGLPRSIEPWYYPLIGRIKPIRVCKNSEKKSRLHESPTRSFSLRLQTSPSPMSVGTPELIPPEIKLALSSPRPPLPPFLLPSHSVSVCFDAKEQRGALHDLC